MCLWTHSWRVEFDTFANPWDPPFRHVGFDVRSLISAASEPWRNNLTEARVSEAWISYRSSSKKFLVNFTEFVDRTARVSGFEYTVDLRDYLPEYVESGSLQRRENVFRKTMLNHGVSIPLWI